MNYRSLVPACGATVTTAVDAITASVAKYTMNKQLFTFLLAL